MSRVVFALPHLIASIAVVLSVIACGDNAPSLTTEDYFTRVVALTDAFDTANSQPSLSAAARETNLRDLAAGLDDLHPPSVRRMRTTTSP